MTPSMSRIGLSGSLLVLGLVSCDRPQPLEPSAQPLFRTAEAPSGVTATAVSESRIDVSWLDNSTNETGFEVYRSTAGGGFTLRASTGPDVTSYADLGLVPMTQYCYRVRSLRTSGRNTSYSQFAGTPCATTPAPPQPPRGVLEVTTRTTGSDFDANGYDVLNSAIPANGTVSISLLVGNYSVGLSGVSMNCSVTSPSPITVAVSSGATTAVVFDVACLPATELAFDGAGIQVIKSNHAVASVLATGPGPNSEPAWSPDGNRIAFRSERDGNAEIYVMNRDGTNLARLTEHPAPDYQPTWSPDGARIAFVSERDGNGEIYVMNADGSNVVRLTTDSEGDGHPAWSPDGAWIAFTRASCLLPYWPYGEMSALSGQIHVMRTDGSAITPLTFCGLAEEGWTSDAQAAWSPDGTRIAFMRWTCFDSYCDPYSPEPENEILVMNADGSSVTWLASAGNAGDGGGPTWSPDGNWIGYAGGSCDFEHGCSYGLSAVKTDGTPVYALLLDLNYLAKNPSWRW